MTTHARGQTDRQIDRQTTRGEGQTDRQTDRDTHRQQDARDRQTDRHLVILITGTHHRREIVRVLPIPPYPYTLTHSLMHDREREGGEGGEGETDMVTDIHVLQVFFCLPLLRCHVAYTYAHKHYIHTHIHPCVCVCVTRVCVCARAHTHTHTHTHTCV